VKRLVHMPAYYKAALIGAGLMLIVATIVAMGYGGIGATYESAARLVFQHYPARDQLLYMDRDLYQAQMALERAARAQTDFDRDAQIAIYEENRQQTEDRFRTFQEMTADVPDPLNITGNYAASRTLWLQAVEALSRVMSEGRAGEELESAIKRTADTFAEMRFTLDRVNGSTMSPLLQTEAEAITARAGESQRMVLVTFVVALLLGTWLTISGVSAIRAQHLAILAQHQQREEETERRNFEQRIHRALQLVQTEESALNVVGAALDDVVLPSHQAEILLADESMAHVRRAVSMQSEEPGCSVLAPGECPALRRNARIDFPTSEVFDACPYLWNRREEGCSACCIPLSIMGRAAGVLHVVGPKGQMPTAAQDHALRTVASRVGDTLGVIRAFATKDRQANTDALTGLCNRRSLEEKIASITSRGSYSVAFADLDCFKRLNDTHGHETGDKALRLFGDVLRASIRPDDVAARWGGEEFVIVLPGLSGAKVIVILERVRERLQDALALGAVPAFSVSFGVSDSRGFTLFEEVLNAADEALLRAKHAGRDRIVYDGAGQDAGGDADSSGVRSGIRKPSLTMRRAMHSSSETASDD
jgi:diguanylate cyclase (GGDEF)-like protein